MIVYHGIFVFRKPRIIYFFACQLQIGQKRLSHGIIEKNKAAGILKTNIKRSFSYSYCAYLRWNAHSHSAVVKNNNSVPNAKIAVAPCINNNFLICFGVADKKLSVSGFQNNSAHCHHSYHL